MATVEEVLQTAIAHIAALEGQLARIKNVNSNSKKRSILDIKACVRLDLFKCAGWHKWSSKMRSLIGQAYPDCGRKLLSNVELYKDPVDHKTLEDDIDIDIEKDVFGIGFRT